MILKGNERAHGAELAHHLLNPRDNDHVTIHAVEGFITDDLFGAFAEAEAISTGTECQKYLFSLSLNPPPDARVTVQEFEQAITAIEAKLGLSGQPRAIVFHEKHGRRHAHVVWSRIDTLKMRSINLPHYKRKLMDISRELYRSHDWDMPDGFLESDARDPNNFRYEEAAQAKRTKKDPKAQKKMFRACWVQPDSRAAFAAALWEQGYLLARGDRRGFVAVDEDGKVWSLSRWCGVKPKELRARLGSEDDLWSIEEAISTFPDLRRREQAKKSKDTRLEFERQRQALVERQRHERKELREAQEARRIDELKDRRARLPKGLKAVWAKLTGQYASLVQKLAEETLQAELRDAGEQQSLIDRHLAERRDLQRDHERSELFDDFNSVFADAVKRDPRQHLVLPKDDIPFTEDQLIAHPELICTHVSHKNAEFTRSDVLRELAKRVRDPMVLARAADKAMAWRGLELLETEKGNRQRFTTKDYLASVSTLETVSAEMIQTGGFNVKRDYADASIRAQNAQMQNQFGGQLSEEQKTAIRHVLEDRQLSLIVGLAGSGKSTMLKTANAAWGRQGLKVHGAALAGKAADGLESASGISSRTLASLEVSWKNGYEPIGYGDVLVVDEAGMVGTRQLARVAAKVREVGAKLVLIGDPDQLQPIEAGTPFRRLIETHGAVRLSEIHRQREEWQRQASRNLADGKIEEAVTAYADKGYVHETVTQNAALSALVEDYLADFELRGPATSRLAFAHRRKDVHALNQAIRSGLRSRGSAPAEYLLETETGIRAFAPGDRIVFTRNDKAVGVKNGMLGTVIKVGDNHLSVVLDSDPGQKRLIEFDPRQFNTFDHGYAVTIHKSQGATVDKSFVLASRTMNDSLTYVALTRHRDSTRIYTSSRDKPRWSGIELSAGRKCQTRWRSGPSL